MSSLVIATSRGPTPWVALPVFTTREFFHTRILVRADAGIAAPADLRGKRVGVPEYQQTAAIWARGVLENEFGVAPREMELFMERGDKSHGGATGFKPPPGRDGAPDSREHQYRRDAHARRARRDAALSHQPQSRRPQPHRPCRRQAHPPAVSRPRRRGPPLLRQDRDLPDQPHRRGAPHARRAAPLDRAQPLRRLRRRARRRAARRRRRRSPHISRPACSATTSGARSRRSHGLRREGDPQGAGDDRRLRARPGAADRRVEIEELFAPATMDL